jgi:hypothetical protein
MKRFLALYESAMSAEDQMVHTTPEQARPGIDAIKRGSTKRVSRRLPVQPSTEIGHGGEPSPVARASP